MKPAFLSIGVLLSLPLSLRAAGTSGAAFLDIPVGAGPASVGSAYSALATDAYAPIWNPAGLGKLDSTEIAGQHLSYLESVNYEFLSVVHPLKPGRALGFSAQYLGSGDITTMDEGGNAQGSYSNTFGAYSLAYGHALSDKFSLGVTGKWIHIRLADVQADAFAADLGSHYRLSDRWSFAATLTNLGTAIKFIEANEPLPMAFRLGTAWKPSRAWQISADGYVRKEGGNGAAFGAQWRPVEFIALRTGYRTEVHKELSALAGFSAGLGLEFWGQEFAYAWVPYGDLGNTNYFSLLLRFGAQDKRRQNLIQRIDKKKGTAKNLKPEEMSAEDMQLMQLMETEGTQKVGQADPKR